MRLFLKPFGTHTHRGRSLAPDLFISQSLGMSLVILLVLLSLLNPVWVHAQSEDKLLVQAPDTSDFPKISLQFKLPDSVEVSGEDLLASQVDVLEDGREVSIQSLQKERRGIHFTLAINGGRAFDLRDSTGSSNFDKLRDVIRTWVISSKTSQDDEWSLIANDGKNLINMTDRGAWLEALMAYTPDFRRMTSSQDSLADAIQFAETRVVSFGVDKAMLYLTTPPSVDEIGEIQALEERAKAAGLQVSVWMVGDPLFLNNDQGGALISLADGTGGNFFYFSGTETLPDPGAFLSRLGFIYTLRYDSQIRQTGTFPLKIQVNRMGRAYRGAPSPFYLEVLPPEVILVDPPRDIHRVGVGEADLTTGALVSEINETVFYPDFQSVKYQISFPDGYPRSITSSRLYVNGLLSTVNKSPSLDLITWDLKDVLQSGEYVLQVEITDSLGLSTRTAEYPVQVIITLSEPEPEPETRENALLLGGIVFGLALLLLTAWLVFQIIRKSKRHHPKGFFTKPSRYLVETAGNLPAESITIYATLIPTGVLDEGWEDRAIQITKRSGIFGGKAGRADYLVQAEGVDGRQARLTLHGEGFWLQDLDSKLGTWINYHQIGIKPVKIQPGDVIHFGNCGFRFTMVNNSLPEKVRIAPYEPIL